ncbi:hypothetical protein AB0H76_06895 [Nocardia sp. NPDC050712]|uniref:hypothetical protein n=1 Tax=Nocardia sp. NPDC050712 TaxID=3155518 RepID=UPI0033E0A439
MEHGQHGGGGESIGVILSGIAEILREVSEKLDAVAARVDDARDERSVAARLAKLEAWAFRTDHDISKLGSRIDGVEGGPRPESGGSGESGRRAEPTTRAERRELARAEAPEQSDLPQRGTGAQRDSVPQRGPTPPHAEAEVHSERPQPRAESEARSERPHAEARGERPLPRAVANRGPVERPEPASTRGTAAVAETALNGDRRLPTVPAALNDWVEPGAEPAERLEPVGITPRTDRFTPSGITEAASTTAPQGMDYAAVRARAESQDAPRPTGRAELPTRTPRLDPSAHQNGRPDTTFTGQSESSVSANGRLDSLTSPGESTQFTGRPDSSAHITGSGRLEPPLAGGFDVASPIPNGRNDSSLTAPRPDLEPQRPSVEDNSHVDKLQAMLDELKRNPHGPFGRPLGTPPGELPA